MHNYLKVLILFTLLLTASQCNDSKEALQHGSWKGVIHYSDAEVPFNFEIYRIGNSDSVQVTIINGEDRAIISDAVIRRDSLIVPMFAFDITLQAEVRGDSMSGTLIKHYRGSSVPFTAVYGKPRYEVSEKSGAAEIPEKMDLLIRYDRDNAYPAVALMKQNENRVSGTILSELSDFRYFEGKIEGDSLTMSSFDGVHAFLITANKEEGLWSGSILFEEGYSEKWKQETEGEHKIRDAFGIIDLSDKKTRPDLSSFSMNGNSIETADYRGKVLMVQIFGTWCPNSWDQTKYLTANYDQWKNEGVEILAVNYEANYSEEYGKRRISYYKDKMNIDYPVLLGGRLNKEEAAEAFPFMDKILAFPTLVILDKEGYARYVHSYFTGPATGQYYENFKIRLQEIITELNEE
ncbi:peroxiredoxin family protein [Balneola sp. MJW-20]|uniref:peroxiredoxin family protein n=1 Tax=Gracilimonas aurantiaca TaxID=3234185 RepID=UPI003465C217